MQTINILIVEDESLIALDISEILCSKLNAKTKIASSFDEAMDLFVNFNPDILFLDINIDGELDGTDIANEIKKVKEIPVIFLTAYSDEKTLQKAFETSPQNYIVKPFKEEDIITAAKLALNCHKKEKMVHFDEIFSFDMETKELFKNKKAVNLTKKESHLLYLLVKNRKKLVEFSTIDYEIWPEDTVHTNTRRTLIYRLRKKLDNRFVETVFGIGCKIIF